MTAHEPSSDVVSGDARREQRRRSPGHDERRHEPRHLFAGKEHGQPHGNGHPADLPPRHAEYEKLQHGGDASLNAIIRENPMLQFAVFQQINLGAVMIASAEVDPATGDLTDLRLVRIERAPPSNHRRRKAA
jgi:hypothetical protein